MKPSRRSRTPAVAHQTPPAPQSPMPMPVAWLSGIGVGALVVRLVYLAAIRQAPFFTVLMGDSRVYDLWARRIAAGDWIGTDVFYQAPLYPYFMAVVYRFLGHDLVALRVCQMVLGSISCGFLAHTAARLFSRRAGVVAGLALALYPPAIFFDGIVQKTAIDAFLTALSLWLVSGILVGRGRWGTWLALGAAMGALGLTRENALALAVVLLVWCAYRFDQQPVPPPRTRARELAAYALGLALLLVPVAVRNYAVTGGFYLTTSQFGPNLYLGNNPRTDGTAGSLIAGRGSSEYERQDAIDIAERASGGRTLSPAEVSSYWTNEVIEYVRAQPLDWVQLMWRKFVLLWNRAEAFDTESQESYAEWWPPLGVLAYVGNFGVLVPLACLGVVAAWSDRRRLSILYLLVVAYAASVVLFFIYARYRFPLVPFLLLFAAAAIVKGSDALRALSVRSRLALAVTLALVAVFANWPMLSARGMRAVTEHNLGAALQTDGRLEDAAEHYRRAIAIDGTYVPAHSNLGTVLAALGRDADAIAEYNRALALDPNFADAHFNLGNALNRLDRPREAIPHFERALALSPAQTDVLTNYGVALLADGQIDAGIARLEAALTMSPRAPIVLRVLGEALSATGRREDGLRYLRDAVSLAPTDWQARHALGRILLEGREPALAVEHFEAALEHGAPVEVRNDLGAALMMTSRMDGAVAQFREVLRQRPGNADARRYLDAVLSPRSNAASDR